MLAADHALYYAARRRRVCPNEQLFSSAIRSPDRQDYGAGVDGSIHAGLEKLVSMYLNRDWGRGGSLMRIDRLLVDMGYKPGIVASVKQKAGGSAMMLAKGIGIRASRKPIAEYARRPSPASFWNSTCPPPQTMSISAVSA
jgi:hypothetical protein